MKRKHRPSDEMLRYKRREYVRDRLKRLGVKAAATMELQEMEARLKQIVEAKR